MRVCNLCSGSSGNITYIESDEVKILVDIGLSCKETELRLKGLNIEPSFIDAILITHEHYDHIKGLDVFAKKHNTKVFVHENGYDSLINKLKNNINIIKFNSENFNLKNLEISTINLPHDVKQCTGYTIQENEKKISIITDLGHTTTEIIQNLAGSSLVFVEANHDPEILMRNIKYPPVLKRRILGNNGHLSNSACADLICELVKFGNLKHIVLSHLSKENNSPDIAYSCIKNQLLERKIEQINDLRIDIAETFPKTIFRL